MKLETGEKDVIRIQFDIPRDLWDRTRRYLRKEHDRHSFGYEAFVEKIGRKEGRDMRRKMEQWDKDKETLRPLILEILQEIKGE